uniref:NADH-ubiquinone oxidoreductase chain 6 n=1 Tax=Biston panterinaria TaxID=1229185 RepID=K9M3U5_BISPA|nr:NADH dehydrogenase subunit 6 [Biston panterinaria]AFQ99230.1 NADH dehydrogenase subunit 6 [Biston panterinaria]ANW36759.1 NADH dehydrogenase subunit 6 [Biston panterinaria]ANW36772.1 NADH dehydrogenase subunit 6 [Biston panterinaria]ANW36811.1 NADH dehydrogenase subunit 6 [Biston panterinaria]
MSKMFLSMMMLMLSIMMIFLNHPLSIGLLILVQTLMMCLLSGMLIKTYWFSYILFLTFLGGLLVLFIYVSSIASNELFKLNINMKTLMIMLFTMIMMMQMYMYMYENLNWMNLSNNISNTNNMMNLSFFNNENKINLNKLYNNHTYMMMSMLVIYLFISLVSIVKITNIFYGPLRTMN